MEENEGVSLPTVSEDESLRCATNPQLSGEMFLEKFNQAHGSKWYQVQRPQINHREGLRAAPWKEACPGTLKDV